MIKLCVFDLDGTTVNSLSSIAHFANRTLEKFGFPPFPEDSYRHLAGGGAKKLISNLVREAGAPEELYEPMLRDWVDSYDADFLYLTKPYDGIREMLADLRGSGIRTAVLTNKHGPTAVKICEALFGIASAPESDGKPPTRPYPPLIDDCVSAFPGMILKPAPDEIYRLLDKYRAQRDECLYCGDHTIDMQTGRGAGVVTVGVTWGFHGADELRAAGADFIADIPSDITSLAARL